MGTVRFACCVTVITSLTLGLSLVCLAPRLIAGDHSEMPARAGQCRMAYCRGTKDGRCCGIMGCRTPILAVVEDPAFFDDSDRRRRPLCRFLTDSATVCGVGMVAGDDDLVSSSGGEEKPSLVTLSIRLDV